MSDAHDRVQVLVANLRSLWMWLVLVLGFGFACPAHGDLLSGQTTVLQQVRSAPIVDLSRISSAGLKDSERRMSRVRHYLNGPKAERSTRALPYGTKSDDAFAIGRRIADPKTLLLSQKPLHASTIGRVRNKSFAKYSSFDKYWDASGTGTRGKFFESQSVIQANSALKRQGSLYRYAITAVEKDPGHAADVVLLDTQTGRILRRFQLKSTHSVDDIIKFASDPKYAGMPIVTHPETVAALRVRLAAELQKAQRRGVPLPSKWLNVDHKLDAGLITDSLGGGKSVDSYATTMKNARTFRLFQWRQGPTDVGKAGQVTKAVTRSIAMPKVISRVGVSIARVAKGTFVVLEVVSAPVNIGFATYGFYDTFTRYSEGSLDRDMFASKLAIHTTEAALGGVAVYSLGVGLGLIAAPEPIVTKVTGIVVVVGGVVVIAADMAVDAIVSGRDHARQQTLEVLTDRERLLASRGELASRLRLVFEN
jgi:hypothetical protein